MTNQFVKTSAAAQLIRQEASRRNGLDFASFVDIALYHPQYGYYNSSRELRGRRGDYFTSLQVSPLFPQIVADAFIAMRRSLGTEQFSLVELGSGNGEFLEAVLDLLRVRKELKGFRVFSVERSRPAREKIYRALSRFPRCEVVSTLEDMEMSGALEGCVFSNEFFDALPFHRVRWNSGSWRQLYIIAQGDSLTEDWRSPDAAVAAEISRMNLEAAELIEGQEIEIRPAAGEVIEEIGHLMVRGFVLTFDYGYAQPALYHPKRANGTWLCFKGHQSNENVLSDIGQQDITAHLNFTHLAQRGLAAGLSPALFCSQGQFLTHVGQAYIQQVLTRGNDSERAKWIGAVQQLIHPDAMGEAFWTLVQAKGVSLPPELQAIPNRFRRLGLRD